MPDQPVSLKEHLERLIADQESHISRILEEKERRYEERFAASEKARDAALASQNKLVAAAFAASEKAGSKAEESATARLDQHNQLQTKMDRQAAAFADKEWVLSLREALEREIRSLADRVARFENREEGMTMTTKIIVGAVGFLATLVGLYFAFR